MAILEGQKARVLSVIVLCLLCALSIRMGVHLRVQHADALENKHLLGLDSYQFVRQAKQIIQNGNVPERDMMKYAPLGWDMRQELKLNSYAIVWFYKSVRVFASDITVEQAAIYFPVMCFVLCLLVFFLLAAELLDRHAAVFATMIFAVIPAAIYRTAAGFADHDALSLLEILLVFYLYIKAIRSAKFYKVTLYSSLSGVATGLLGLTWSGAGLIIGIIVMANFILLITDKYASKDAYIYLFWYLPVVIMLLTLTRRYIRLLDHVAFFAFVPPSVFLVLLALYFAIRRSPSRRQRLSFSSRLPLGMSLSIVASAACMILGVFALGPVMLMKRVIGIPEYLLHPLGNNRLMNSIGELKPYRMEIWWAGYGLLIPFLFIGFALILYRVLSHYGFRAGIVFPLVSIVLLGVVFTAVPFASALDGNSGLLQWICLGSIALFAFGCLWFYLRSRRSAGSTERGPLDKTLIFIAVWFLVLLVLTRGARRFSIVFAPVAVIAAVYAVRGFIHRIADGKPEISNLLFLCMGAGVLSWSVLFSGDNDLPNLILQTASFGQASIGLHRRLSLNISVLTVICSVVVGIIALRKSAASSRGIVSWVVLMLVLVVTVGGVPHIARGYVGSPTPSPDLTGEWQEALDWLKGESASDSVIAAWWNVGNWLEAVAERATVADNSINYYIPYRIHLLARHVFLSSSEVEALECLKTYGATHLLISARDLTWHYGSISSIGSDEDGDRVSFLQLFTPEEQGHTGCSESAAGSQGGCGESAAGSQGGCGGSAAGSQGGCGGNDSACEENGHEDRREETTGVRLDLAPFLRLYPRVSMELNGKMYAPGIWHLSGMRVTLDDPDHPEVTMRISASGEEIELPVREVEIRGERYVSDAREALQGIVFLSTLHDSNCGGGDAGIQGIGSAFYLDERAYETLMVQLYLLGNHKDGFELVYPNAEHPNSDIYIWKLEYSESIMANTAYLERTSPNAELYKPLSDY